MSDWQEEYPHRRRKKRKRKRCFRRLIKLTAGIVVFAFLLNRGMSFIGDHFILTDSGIAIENGANVQNGGAAEYVSGADVRGKLEEMAASSETVRQILEHSDQYPEELLELLANNEETADFVLDYPQKKDQTPADSIGEVTTGVIPHLLQWDERWGYAVYGDHMIAINGCGPTALAMAAAGLTGDGSITPYRVARYAAEQGYYEGEAGTSWALMTEGAAAFGVQGQELGLSRDEIFAELESGHPIICSMRPGDFTSTGHFIVLVGIEDGKIRVNDPNSRVRSGQLWEYETLEYQINNLWAFTAA